jgi:aminoglycoside 3-N-acetyltransferase
MMEMDRKKTIKKLAESWAKSGILIGDMVLVHSSLKRTFVTYKEQGYEISPEIILDSFLEAVGERGTVVLPLFNMEFGKGVPFDMRSTPSHMGALTNVARVHPDSVRSGHPMYNFCAIGRYAEMFNMNNTSGAGPDSPFSVINRARGKVAIIDLTDQYANTMVHYAEELNDADYRFHKEFTGEYTDLEGNTEVKTYTMHVRRIEEDYEIMTDLYGFEELTYKAGITTGNKPLVGNGMRVMAARDIVDLVTWAIKSGQAETYLYKKDKVGAKRY